MLVSEEDKSGSQETVTTDESGNFSPTAIWAISSNASITQHEFDIVVNNGTDETGQTYNAADDGWHRFRYYRWLSCSGSRNTDDDFILNGLALTAGYVVMRKKD